MCDVAAIAALLIAAEVAFGFAIGFSIAGAALSGNFFTGGASVALLVAALASIAVAMAFLTLVMQLLNSCRSGTCGTFAATAWNEAAGALAALAVLAAMCGILIPGVVIPGVGVAVAIGMVASIVASGVLFALIADRLTRLDTCIAAGASTATTVALVVAVVNFVGVLIFIGFSGMEFAGEASGCVGTNC